MNFIKEVEAGMKGRYHGLDIGLPRLNNFMNGVQKRSYYLVGAQAKSGKTALVDKQFIISPYLLNKDKDINWIYFSFEVDLLEKLAKYCAFFMDKEYNIYCDANYVLSRGNNKLTDEHKPYINKIYDKYLLPMFGEFDKNGNILTPGRIDFVQQRNNPEGIRKYLLNYAKENGKFITSSYTDNSGTKREKLIGYEENNPDLYTIILIDHVGLIKLQSGMSKKENLDKLSSHLVWFRNLCNFTPVAVSQFNRDLGKTDRMKFSGEQLQPSLEDFKDSGNMGEDATMVLALFNPYNYPHLGNHLGYDIKPFNKTYRSAHILASRNTESNVNISLMLEGKTGNFMELPKPEDRDKLEKVYKYVKQKRL